MAEHAKLLSPSVMERITAKDIALLRGAVDSHEVWRGQYIGHPDAGEVLAAFDAEVAAMHKVLGKLRRIAKASRQPRVLEVSNG